MISFFKKIIIKIIIKTNHIINSFIIKYPYFKFQTKNLLIQYCGINQKKRLVPIIISLTSFPPRLKYLHLTLASLLNQSEKPDRIILWLSQNEIKKDDLPKKIKKLQNKGIEIKFIQENIKSYKKLIYTLKIIKNGIIITTDDDEIYPQDFIKKMIDKYDKKNIIAYRCRYMKKIKKSELSPYQTWKHAKSNKPSFNLFPIGVGGILYPPNSLNKEVFNKKIYLKYAPTGDDIWFKAMALLNNRKTIMVNQKSKKFISINKAQETNLWKNNVLNNKNDEQIKNIFDYYNLYKYIK